MALDGPLAILQLAMVRHSTQALLTHIMPAISKLRQFTLRHRKINLMGTITISMEEGIKDTLAGSRLALSCNNLITPITLSVAETMCMLHLLDRHRQRLNGMISSAKIGTSIKGRSKHGGKGTDLQ